MLSAAAALTVALTFYRMLPIVSAAEGVRAVLAAALRGSTLFAELTEFSRDHSLEHLDELIATELVVETHLAGDGRLNALRRPGWLCGLRPSPPRLA